MANYRANYSELLFATAFVALSILAIYSPWSFVSRFCANGIKLGQAPCPEGEYYESGFDGSGCQSCDTLCQLSEEDCRRAYGCLDYYNKTKGKQCKPDQYYEPSMGKCRSCSILCGVSVEQCQSMGCTVSSLLSTSSVPDLPPADSDGNSLSILDKIGIAAASGLVAAFCLGLLIFFRKRVLVWCHSFRHLGGIIDNVCNDSALLEMLRRCCPNLECYRPVAPDEEQRDDTGGGQRAAIAEGGGGQHLPNINGGKDPFNADRELPEDITDGGRHKGLPDIYGGQYVPNADGGQSEDYADGSQHVHGIYGEQFDVPYIDGGQPEAYADGGQHIPDIDGGQNVPNADGGQTEDNADGSDHPTSGFGGSPGGVVMTQTGNTVDGTNISNLNVHGNVQLIFNKPSK